MKFRGTITYEHGGTEEFKDYEKIENDGEIIYLYKDKDDLDVYRSFKMIPLYCLRSIDVHSYEITEEEREKRRKVLEEREEQDKKKLHENMLI